MNWGTLSLIEALFLVIVTPGWALSVLGTWRALGDWRMQRLARRNGARLLVARIMVYVYLASLAGFTLLELVGVQLATAPPPISETRNTTLSVLVWVYIGLTIVKTAATVYADRLKHHLVVLLARRAEEGDLH